MAASRALSQKLVAQLSVALGRSSAAQELKWMSESSSSTSTLEKMVERRLRGEPLQYILGTQPFGPLDLLIRAPVLIPRPETEDWTLRLAKLLKPSPARPFRLLDLCTGSGCIPLLLCHTWPAGSIKTLGIDIGNEAVQLAIENARRTGIADALKTRADKNNFSVLQADILEDNFVPNLRSLGWSSFDVLTSNPPYIPLSEYNQLSPSVKDYEDVRALLGDPKSRPSDGRGLTFYRAIARLVGHVDDDGNPPLVKPGGVIALEVGHNQGADVQHLMETEGRVQKTEVWKDPWGVDRTVISWK
ncbi:S-adenosyl-L-methionine-dependent methyltransferase [Phellopilus nigrolimitatus]|nr:S-adenosyl-L-methionine-dependent methyltransferase [Phellopilus nigrolimitatus]